MQSSHQGMQVLVLQIVHLDVVMVLVPHAKMNFVHLANTWDDFRSIHYLK